MAADLFVGTPALQKAHQLVGSIIDACAHLEEAISYLEWQLTAFSSAASNPSASAADLQASLNTERETRDKYDRLDTRLTRVTKGFEAEAVSKRVKKVPRLREMRREWEVLRERGRALGKLRNEVSHSFLAFQDGKIIRQVGRPWNEQQVVPEEHDMNLCRDLWEMTREVETYSTELGNLLPFVDMNQIFTVR
jgi:hypothetical protein